MRRNNHEIRDAENDILGYTPSRFVTAYHELISSCMLMASSGDQEPNTRIATPKRKYSTHTGGLRDEASMRFKAWVDRELRVLARDMEAFIHARGAEREYMRARADLKCKGCGKYVQWHWHFCAWCGHVMVHTMDTLRTRNEERLGIISNGE
jgi:hypothetical protein